MDAIRRGVLGLTRRAGVGTRKVERRGTGRGGGTRKVVGPAGVSAAPSPDVAQSIDDLIQDVQNSIRDPCGKPHDVTGHAKIQTCGILVTFERFESVHCARVIDHFLQTEVPRLPGIKISSIAFHLTRGSITFFLSASTSKASLPGTPSFTPLAANPKTILSIDPAHEATDDARGDRRDLSWGELVRSSVGGGDTSGPSPEMAETVRGTVVVLTRRLFDPTASVPMRCRVARIAPGSDDLVVHVDHLPKVPIHSSHVEELAALSSARVRVDPVADFELERLVIRILHV